MNIPFQSMPGSANTVASQKQRILVVEDSKDIRDLLGELLEEEGYDVLFAESGQEALSEAPRSLPHLILMDLSLPGMSGLETVALLRQFPEFKNTPIVAVTAHASPRDEERALAGGCDGYISKPFDVDVILERIAGYVSGR